MHLEPEAGSPERGTDDASGAYVRDSAYLEDRITADGRDGWPVEPGRYRPVNPTQIVPAGPDLSSWLTPHGREELGGRPFGDGTPPGPPRPEERVDPAHTPIG